MDELRIDYVGVPLLEPQAASDPFQQFGQWFDQAVASGIELANAMTLATATRDGVPSARVVLLKQYDEAGFCFFTSYLSHKAQELEDNPRAHLSFWWGALMRQVRIGGSVSRVPASESDEYFGRRPRESNLSAMASPQSAVVASRAELERRVERLRAQHADKELVRPDSWGGYRLVPDYFEFWQGQENRLHDRLCYRREGDGWVRERLAP